MDRSVDSIGSCSLDVDADSTDFSDTSGELNFLTPISGKDITREFTAGIKERCMLPVINCQAVTSVLDPVTGHISTVLTTTTATNSQQQQQQQPLLGGDSSPTAVTNKKPSYLNLACCVNGYSNLTTYDSKLRQDINKSREVSPSRPIIATLHYNRTDSGTGGHLLTAPTLSYVSMNNTINNNNNYNSGSGVGIGGGNRMLKMNGAGVVNGAGGGRMRGMNGSIMSPSGGADMTDNAASIGLFNGNGSFVSSMRTKVISSQSQISSHARDDAQSQLMTPKKSFIQQRVEKLYGASEVVVLNKQNYSSSERKYLNNIANENNGTVGGTPVKMIHQLIGNGTTRNGVANGTVTNGATNGSAFVSVDENNKQINGDGHVGEDADVDSLPVMRHLRPEFRAQLQIFSPKKVPKSSPNRTATTIGGSTTHTNNTNGNVTHANGNTAEENANLLHTVSKRYPQSNGNSYIDHFEQLSVSREEQDHRKNLTGDGTQRTVMKTAQLASHTTRTTTTTTTTSTNGTGILSSNGRHTEQEQQEDALNTSNRHHSNAISTRSAAAKQTDVIEQQQQQHHETSQSYRPDSMSPSSVSSSAVIVEEAKQQRSLVVVVSSTTADGNGVGRMSTSDGSSATIVTVTTTVPDEQNATTVATSVIENGEQNGTRLSNHSTNNNASEGLAQVSAAVCATAENGAVNKSGSGEIVNCDSNNQLVTADSMRTVNGNSTTLMDSAAVIKLPMPMAGLEDAEEDIPTSSSKPASTSFIEATSNGTNGNTVLDGNHFLRILKTEQKRLRTMADVVEGEINQLKADGVVLGEDINGYILAAVGKARLLCSQKMKQFEDLCYTNLNQSPDEKFQTTGEDLRGFWDMVMLQVNNVDASFDEIDSFRKNSWRKPIPKSPPPAQARNGTAPRTKLVKRPYKTQTTASNGGSTVTDGSNGVEAKKASAALAAAKREAQRKQLMEMKRKQKLANSQQQTAVEIFAPSNEVPSAQNGDDNASCTGASTVLTASPLVDTS
ncbi:uncharacterized protein DDB_G0283357-like [Anopheles funestus]|uniref:uncharacterized protein DDB_G0283357-like n=1 Tax=Anopheles funestus TaxID=62324 RepID=UPI0020C6E4BC|nr:uncharacterized protein DDB_G0283357-like [Anopheles funestus]XP_049284697.1 uncharacterized protein DDB_G0283357-like [Anopheles funestus]